MKSYVVLLCAAVICLRYNANCAMTEKQLQAATKLVRNMCQPKTKATDEDLQKMKESGDFNVDKTAKCYLWCALNSNKIISPENTFNYDMAVALANKNLPEARREPSIETAKICRDSAKTLDDKCTAGWEIAKCMYESNPSNYFIP